MDEPSQQMPFEKLIEALVERALPELEKRIKPRKVYTSDDSGERQFTEDQVKDLCQIIKEHATQKTLLKGLLTVVCILLVPTFSMLYTQICSNIESSHTKDQVKEIKEQVIKIADTIGIIKDNSDKAIEASRKSTTAVNDWRARFKYAKDKQGQIYIYPDTEDPQ